MAYRIALFPMTLSDL